MINTVIDVALGNQGAVIFRNIFCMRGSLPYTHFYEKSMSKVKEKEERDMMTSSPKTESKNQITEVL